MHDSPRQVLAEALADARYTASDPLGAILAALRSTYGDCAWTWDEAGEPTVWGLAETGWQTPKTKRNLYRLVETDGDR